MLLFIYRSPRRHIVREPHVGPDSGSVAYGDTAEDGSVWVNYHIVADDGVAWNALDGKAGGIVEGKRARAKGDALIYFHIVADDTCGADHHAGAMVDGKPRADRGPGVDVDSGLAVGKLAYGARNQRHTHLEQRVGDTVTRHGPHRWIARNDFGDVLRGRVAVENGTHIVGKGSAQLRQPLDKLPGHVAGRLGVGCVAAVAVERQPGVYLAREQCVEPLDAHADMIAERCRVGGRHPEIAGENDRPAQFHYFFKVGHRRQGLATGAAVKKRRIRPFLGQQIHYMFKFFHVPQIIYKSRLAITRL